MRRFSTATQSVATVDIKSKFSTTRVPPNYWKNQNNLRRYFDWLGFQLGVKQLSDWYQIKTSAIKENGGWGILGETGASLQAALKRAYPDYPWLPWKFIAVSKGYWEDKTKQREYFDWLGKELGIKNYQDWYNVIQPQITKLHGSKLLPLYGNSVAKALMSVYPEHPWQPWRFHAVPRGYWNEIENVRQYISWVGEQLGVQKLEDWDVISQSQIPRLDAIVQRFGSFKNMLSTIYPQHKWKDFSPLETTSKGQLLLHKYMKTIFKGYDTILNYRHSEMIFAGTNREMELDIYIPELSLAFEYQGEHHYKWHFIRGTPQIQQQRDREKKEVCKSKGITLIDIPYWWDRKMDSLLGSIYAVRPDLLPVLQQGVQGRDIPVSIPSLLPIPSSYDSIAKKHYKVDEVLRFPFSLAVGKRRPKCRGCHTLIPTKSPRIVIRAIFTPLDGVPYPFKAYTCVNYNCLVSAVQNNPLTFPKFEGKIFVPQDLKSVAEKEPSFAGKVEWIEDNK